jgi:hypothetical protein
METSPAEDKADWRSTERQIRNCAKYNCQLQNIKIINNYKTELDEGRTKGDN